MVQWTRSLSPSLMGRHSKHTHTHTHTIPCSIHKRWKRYRQVQLTYTSVLEKPENQYVVQNELATVDSPTEDDTQTDGTEKDDTQKDNTLKDDTKKDAMQAPEDTAL